MAQRSSSGADVCSPYDLHNLYSVIYAVNAGGEII